MDRYVVTTQDAPVAGPDPHRARYECGICWHIYDPEIGDDYSQIPPGTPFDDLPAHWTCPECDAPKHKFMVAVHD